MSEQTEVTLNVEATGNKIRPYSFGTNAFVWQDVLVWMADNSDAAIRKGVAKDISGEYSGNYEGDDTVVTITPTAKNAPAVAEALNAMGIDVNLAEVPQPEKAARTSTAKSKEPTFCEFSGEPTGGGHFRPGYDMKMRGALTRIIDNPNLSEEDEVEVGEGNAVTPYTVQGAIDKLVSYGWYTKDNLDARRAKALSEAQAKIDAKAERERVAAEAKAAKAAAKEAPAEAAA